MRTSSIRRYRSVLKNFDTELFTQRDGAHGVIKFDLQKTNQLHKLRIWSLMNYDFNGYNLCSRSTDKNVLICTDQNDSLVKKSFDRFVYIGGFGEPSSIELICTDQNDSPPKESLNWFVYIGGFDDPSSIEMAQIDICILKNQLNFLWFCKYDIESEQDKIICSKLNHNKVKFFAATDQWCFQKWISTQKERFVNRNQFNNVHSVNGKNGYCILSKREAIKYLRFSIAEYLYRIRHSKPITITINSDQPMIYNMFSKWLELKSE